MSNKNIMSNCLVGDIIFANNIIIYNIDSMYSNKSFLYGCNWCHQSGCGEKAYQTDGDIFTYILVGKYGWSRINSH